MMTVAQSMMPTINTRIYPVYDKHRHAVVAKPVTMQEALGRYDRMFGPNRLKARILRMIALSELCWDLAESLCDNLARVKDLRAKGSVRKIKLLRQEFLSSITHGLVSGRQELETALQIGLKLESGILQPHVSAMLDTFRKHTYPRLLCDKKSRKLIYDRDSLECYLILRAYVNTLMSYSLSVDSDFHKAGCTNIPRHFVLPSQMPKLHKILESLDANMATAVWENPIPEWVEFYERCMGGIAQLGVFTHPANDTYCVFRITDERIGTPQTTPIPGKGDWILVVWTAPLAYRFFIGEQLKVFGAWRRKDGSLLVKTDKGLITSASYDFEIIP